MKQEIQSVDECTKAFQYIQHILQDMNMTELLDIPTPIYNDNAGCVAWSNTVTNRNLRHLQMRENVVRENVQKKYIKILHCDGIENIADIFTKEDKDKQHFLLLRDILVQDPRAMTRIDDPKVCSAQYHGFHD